MRPVAALVFATLFTAGLAVAKPLDNQVVLSDGDRVDFKPSWSYSDCGTPNDIVTIKSVVVTPDPPQPGKNLTVEVVATARERIEEGAYAEVSVKLGIIKLLTKTFDLCEEARNANASIRCPIEPGPYQVQHTVALPKEIPRLKFDVDINAFTVDDEDLLCLSIVADFTPKGPFPRLW